MKNKLGCLVILFAVFTVGCTNKSVEDNTDLDVNIEQTEQEVEQEIEEEMEEEIQEEVQSEEVVEQSKSSAELEELLAERAYNSTAVDADTNAKERADLQNELANAYYNEGNYEKAIEWAGSSSEITRESFVVYNNTVLIGDCYQELGEFEKAINKYDEANELDVDSELVKYNEAYILTQKSRAYMELGQFEEAKKYIDEVIYITDETKATAIDKIYGYMILASIYYEKGDIDSASIACEEGYMFAIKANEYEPAISMFMLRAMLHEEIGDYDKAYEIVSDAIIFCDEVLSLGFNDVIYEKQLMLENYRTYLDSLR